MKVCEIFQGFQGEGKTIGQNSIFLRLSGCTLNCGFCDTKYHTEGKVMTIPEVIEQILKYDSSNIVITGGEPLLWQDEIIQLIKFLSEAEKNYSYTIETNGTIIPKQELVELVELFSCSPKMASSGNELEKRMNYDALEAIRDSFDSIFKFVISDMADLQEAKFLVNQIGIRKLDVYLMKEGKTQEEQLDVEQLMDICKEEGFNFSPRMHIIFFNQKRGV